MSTELPADFHIAGLAREMGIEFHDELYCQIAALVFRLSQIAGLPVDQAKTVAVDILVKQACSQALEVACDLHGREPSRDRWIEACGDAYDTVLAITKGGAA